MSTAAPALMTTEEMLDLPADGMDRELIRGEQEISAEPFLPGFRALVARFFAI